MIDLCVSLHRRSASEASQARAKQVGFRGTKTSVSIQNMGNTLLTNCWDHFSEIVVVIIDSLVGIMVSLGRTVLNETNMLDIIGI